MTQVLVDNSQSQFRRVFERPGKFVHSYNTPPPFHSDTLLPSGYVGFSLTVKFKCRTLVAALAARSSLWKFG